MSSEISSLPNLSSAAWTIATRSLFGERTKNGPVLVLVADSELAQDLAQELDAILGKLGHCEILGAHETNLIRHRGPSHVAKMQRLRALSALHQLPSATQAKVVFVAADALCQPAASKAARSTSNGMSSVRERGVPTLISKRAP